MKNQILTFGIFISSNLHIICSHHHHCDQGHKQGEEAQGASRSLITIESKGRSTSVIDDIFFCPSSSSFIVLITIIVIVLINIISVSLLDNF